MKALSAERVLVVGYRGQDPRDDRRGSLVERHPDADRSRALQHPVRRRAERVDLRTGRRHPRPRKTAARPGRSRRAAPTSTSSPSTRQPDARVRGRRQVDAARDDGRRCHLEGPQGRAVEGGHLRRHRARRAGSDLLRHRVRGRAARLDRRRVRHHQRHHRRRSDLVAATGEPARRRHRRHPRSRRPSSACIS